MKLQSTTDLSLEKNEFGLFKYNVDVLRNNSKFLKQPLELWMFVPRDLNGEIIDELDYNILSIEGNEKTNKYQEAKERVLFPLKIVYYSNCLLFFINDYYKILYKNKTKEFILFKGGHSEEIKSVEQIASINIGLSESAIKKIGL